MKATTEEIVAAYRECGSVWKTAKRLGMCGQSVWERLRALQYPMRSCDWTDEEVAELKSMVGEMTISDIANRLGRPYAGVAGKISKLGIGVRAGNRIKRKLPRGAGYDKATTLKHVRDLKVYAGSLRQFALSRALALTPFAEALKKHAPEFWHEFSSSKGLPSATCPSCGIEYYPTTAKQKACSNRCTYALRTDLSYFGGKRSQTIGLAERVCQLCGKHRERGLHSHHVYGKENDPENEILIAVCPGCHAIIGKLAKMRLVSTTDGWESLIHLVEARRRGEDWRGGKFFGTYVCVDVELISEEEELEELAENEAS